MANTLPLFQLPACAQCGHQRQGTRAKGGNSVKCHGCGCMRWVSVSRPMSGPDDPYAVERPRGRPMAAGDDPRRGPGVPRPDQLDADGHLLPVRPRTARVRPTRSRPGRPSAPIFGGTGSRRKDPVVRYPEEEPVPLPPSAQEWVSEQLEAVRARKAVKKTAPIPQKRSAQRPAPVNPYQGIAYAPAGRQLMGSQDIPLEFSLPPVYMACTECRDGQIRNERGIYNQAGIYVRITRRDSGAMVGEGNLCRAHYREFVKAARKATKCTVRYSRELRPGI